MTGGAVFIDSDARLAISGNFTITGTGAVSFKGAGAELTSDGAVATLTNDSTIGLAPTLESSGFSGQLGDQGLLSVNDLTYVNNGTTYASGSGYTLTINTGANVVTNGANGTLAAENGGLLKIVSNLSNAGVVDVGTSSSSSVGATTGTVDLGSDGGSESLQRQRHGAGLRQQQSGNQRQLHDQRATPRSGSRARAPSSPATARARRRSPMTATSLLSPRAR